MAVDRNVSPNAVSALTRLYFLFEQNLRDRRFCERDGGKIIYIVDNDVTTRFIDPFSETSARYMRILEDIHSDRAAPVSQKLRNLLAASAYQTTDYIFRGDLAGQLLLSHAYRDALLSQASHLARTRIKSNLSSLNVGSLSSYLRELRSNLNNLNYDRLLDLRKRAPDIALSVMFHDDDPLEKLASIIEPLMSSNQAYLSEMPKKDLEYARNLEIIESQLFQRRRYLISKGLRSEINLRENIVDDAQAIMDCILLNDIYEDRKVRFIFLTGDSGIHHFIDGCYRSDPPAGWPSFNFVRRPVQFSEFFTNDGEETSMILPYLQFIIKDVVFNSEKKYNSIFNAMYHWFDGREDVGDAWKGLSSSSLAFMGTALRQTEAAVIKARESSLLLYTATLAKKVKEPLDDMGFLQDVTSVLGDDAVCDFLTKSLTEYKQSFAKLSPYILRDERMSTEAIANAWEWILEAIRPDGSVVGNGRGRHRRRLPLFPLFSDNLAETIHTITLGKKDGYLDFLKGIANLDVLDVHQINIFIAGFLNRWKEAADIAELAVQSTSDRVDRLAELHYLRCVALRHIEGATQEQLRDASEAINRALSIVSEEPRYFVEKAAVAISKLYHAHYYTWNLPSAELDTRCVLDDLVTAEEKFKGRNYSNQHVSSRFLSQLFANRIIYIMLSYPFDLIVDERISDPSSREMMLDSATDGLAKAIDSRGGLDSVSDYLGFLLSAGRLMLAITRGDIALFRKILDEISLRAISSDGLIPYDRKKVDDIVMWAKDILDRTEPRAPEPL